MSTNQSFTKTTLHSPTWGKKIKILQLEDQLCDPELINIALKKSKLDFERLLVDTRDKFIKALKTFSPDIILSDHSLPSINSHEALILLHESGLKIPFILITATLSEEFALDVIKRGADDYILKDRLQRLPISIVKLLEKFQMETERQIFLDKVIRNEKYYRALIENGADAVVVMSAEGKPLYASPAVQKVLGYTEEEAMLLDLSLLTHPEDISLVSSQMKEVIASPGKTIKADARRMLHKDGSWRWLEPTLTNMLHDPAINGIVDNFHDVTEKKLADEKIVQLNRLYNFISQINQIIVHVKVEQELFNAVCKIAVNIGKFELAWIGIADEPSGKINLVAEEGAISTDLEVFSSVAYKKNG
ncbi:MAG: PAS domain S-box protein, partial [Ferruginibacter sp.]